MPERLSPPFTLSARCRAAGIATPGAERRERRQAALFSAAIVAAAALLASPAGWTALSVCLALSLGAAAWLFRRQTAVFRRRRALWTAPFDAGYDAFLKRRVTPYRRLDAEGRELFRQRAKIFLAETVFNGAGVGVDDRLRLLAAAAAVVPTLGFPEWQWPGLGEIIFRPEGYGAGSFAGDEGVVTEFEESGMVGTSGVLSGVMMLSSEDLAWEFAHPGEGANVGFHEFAHLMSGDGLALLTEEDGKGWDALLERERRRLRPGETLLDDYALMNRDELFAVATELFFTVPRAFRNRHRDLYAALARAYRQDPRRWLEERRPRRAGPAHRRRGGRRVQAGSGGGITAPHDGE